MQHHVNSTRCYGIDTRVAALTAYNHSLLYEQCTLLNSTTNNTYYHVDTYDQYTFKNVERERDYYDVFAGFCESCFLHEPPCE